MTVPDVGYVGLPSAMGTTSALVVSAAVRELVKVPRLDVPVADSVPPEVALMVRLVRWSLWHLIFDTRSSASSGPNQSRSISINGPMCPMTLGFCWCVTRRSIDRHLQARSTTSVGHNAAWRLVKRGRAT